MTDTVPCDGCQTPVLRSRATRNVFGELVCAEYPECIPSVNDTLDSLRFAFEPTGETYGTPFPWADSPADLLPSRYYDEDGELVFERTDIDFEKLLKDREEVDVDPEDIFVDLRDMADDARKNTPGGHGVWPDMKSDCEATATGVTDDMTDDTDTDDAPRADLPPWEPIADWLARIDDSDDEPTPFLRPAMSQSRRRSEYEETAKAIAYDIARYDE